MLVLFESKQFGDE